MFSTDLLSNHSPHSMCCLRTEESNVGSHWLYWVTSRIQVTRLHIYESVFFFRWYMLREMTLQVVA